MSAEDQNRLFACSQCPKVFATRSNLKRHMENPNIHNIPYIRSRDQKRWKGHSKKIISREETTESNNDRMRKWRAENREKNRQNDLRCRVYRLARQRYGDDDSLEKQGFVKEEIARRLGRRMIVEQRETECGWRKKEEEDEEMVLPFYSVPQQKIELPSIPCLPELSPTLQRRTSSSSSTSSASSNSKRRRSSTPQEGGGFCVLPAMQTFLSYAEPPMSTKGGIKYVEPNKILDEFVGVVLNYVDNNATLAQS